jgi:hypothetical protein
MLERAAQLSSSTFDDSSRQKHSWESTSPARKISLITLNTPALQTTEVHTSTLNAPALQGIKVHTSTLNTPALEGSKVFISKVVGILDRQTVAGADESGKEQGHGE